MIKKVLSRILDVRTRVLCFRKIRKIKLYVQPAAVDRRNMKLHVKRWATLSKLVVTDWLVIYQHITGLTSIDYVPEDIYYCYVEPALNFKPMSNAETCKSRYVTLYPSIRFPDNLLVNENGLLYNALFERMCSTNIGEYLKSQIGISTAIVVKPSLDSGGGIRVRKFHFNTNMNEYMCGDISLSIPTLDTLYKRDYVVQRLIVQHEFFAKFNASSVNTLRVLTYRSVESDDIHILHTILRVGTPGSIIDNQASGGFAIGVSNEGRLSDYAVNKLGIKTNIVNGIRLSEVEHIPSIERFHSIAKNLASQVRYSRLLGLDLIMNDNDEIMVIEINNVNNEINFYQMNNGPLFGEFTQEIIDYCGNSYRSYCLDYSI